MRAYVLTCSGFLMSYAGIVALAGVDSSALVMFAAVVALVGMLLEPETETKGSE
jgi:hypothetical protein